MLDLYAVGNNIRDLRVKHKYSQDCIAELLGVSHQAVSRWELGLAVPSVDNLVELCALFDVSFEEILQLNKEINLDTNDIFAGHSRMFVIKKIINSEVNYDVVKNFSKFLPQERLMILKAIKDGKIAVDNAKLLSKLTVDERRFITKR